jgi:putative Holliday junction resolvase
MGRWAAIDYGSQRIGLALSDPAANIASPAGTLDAAGSPEADARRVADWARDRGVSRLVVGLPLNMDGSAGPQARFTQAFVEALRKATDLPVETFDERLTSFQADEWLAEQNLSRAAQKKRRDTLAALAILQSFLQSRGS